MSESLENIKNFRKDTLKKLLDQCTEPQQQIFNRMYGSLAEIPDEKIDWAIQQCERTIIKNKKG